MLSSSISSSNNDDDDDIKEAKDTDESEYYMVKWEQELRHPPLEGKCILGYDYENKKFHLCQYRQGQRRTIKILYEDNNFFRSDVKKIYEPLYMNQKVPQSTFMMAVLLNLWLLTHKNMKSTK